MNLDKIKTLGILGDRDTCKTNLMFSLCKKYKGDKGKYLLGYPVKVEGFINVYSIDEITELTDSIICIDELQRIIPFYNNAANNTLLDLLSTMAHNRNVVIFTTCLTQFITKALDGFIDGFCYTRMSDLGALKNGSKAKRRLMEFRHPKINKWSANLFKGEYLEVIDSNKAGENGLKSFRNMGIKKDWEKL